ncbi:hypothetical protein B0T13DRAFT_478375 [Neurospora crassa]|nr:hypothetical protein B0T13DRAFT_478375 [Neurospora crassa]
MMSPTVALPKFMLHIEVVLRSLENETDQMCHGYSPMALCMALRARRSLASRYAIV